MTFETASSRIDTPFNESDQYSDATVGYDWSSYWSPDYQHSQSETPIENYYDNYSQWNVTNEQSEPKTKRKCYKRRRDDQPLNAEDEERKRRRRERNKVAATKCRNKKKIHVNRLCSESASLELANNNLKQEIQNLERESRELMMLFQKHLPYCCLKFGTSCSMFGTVNH